MCFLGEIPPLPGINQKRHTRRGVDAFYRLDEFLANTHKFTRLGNVPFEDCGQSVYMKKSVRLTVNHRNFVKFFEREIRGTRRCFA